jgi:hypothetical protein
MLPFEDGVHGVMGWTVSGSTGVAVSDLVPGRIGDFDGGDTGELVLEYPGVHRDLA